jgi:hypothetical protein
MPKHAHCGHEVNEGSLCCEECEYLWKVHGIPPPYDDDEEEEE